MAYVKRSLYYIVYYLREIFTDAMTGELLKEGDVFVWPNLAKTLRSVAEKGAEEFYSGQVGQDLADDLQKAGSIITSQDLKDYR
jgi:gamma-glutamyltranspeptidase